MTGTWRVASRLARREVRRRPGRTALVSLLVAIPVAGMLIALVLLRAVPLEGAWADDLRLGSADVLISGRPIDPAVLPPGSTLASAKIEERSVRTVDRERSSLVVTDLPLSGLTDGIVRVDAGRAPREAGEALLSPTVARDLDIGIGDELRLSRPDGVVLDVVGIGARSDQLDQDLLLIAPDSPWPWRNQASTMSFVALPDDFSWTETPGIQPLRDDLTMHAYGWSEGDDYQRGFANTAHWAYDQAGRDLFVTVRPSIGVPPLQRNGGPIVYEVGDGYATAPLTSTKDTLIISWIYVMGVVVAVVVGIVITAAFAVSGRRQVTTLGQLAASGASPGALRRMLVLQGTWTGVVGVVTGVVLAWIVLLVGRPPLERVVGWAFAPSTLRPAEVVPVVFIGLGAATIAALVPARRAAKLSILACLAGRRPTAPASLLVAMAGFVAIVGGLSLMAFSLASAGRESTGADERWGFLVAGASVALLLGACAAIPLLVGRLESLADRLHGSWRVGVRSLARQRTRTGAVVAAIAVSAGLAVTASTLYLGDEAQRNDTYSYSWSDGPSGSVAFGPGQSVASATQTTLPDVVTSGDSPDNADLGRDLVVLTTRQTTDQGGAVPGPVAADPTAVSDVEALIPGASKLTLDIATAPSGGAIGWALEPTKPTAGVKEFGADPVVATSEVQDLYELTPSQRASLEEHGALAMGGTGEGEGALTLVGAPGTATVGTSEPSGMEYLLPTLLITPGFATEFGLPTVPADVVFSVAGPLPDEARGAVNDLSNDLQEDYGDASMDGPVPRTTVDLWTGDSIRFESPSDGRMGGGALQGLLAALVLVISMLVIAVNLWLAAAENREERDLLAIVGASPRTLRRSSSVKAVLLVLLGAVIAVPLGFIPATVITRSAPLPQPVVFPWTVALLIIVVVPIVTYAVTSVAGTLTGIRHRSRDLIFRSD